LKLVRTFVLSLLVAVALFGQAVPPAKAPDRPVPAPPALSREVLSAPVAASARLAAAVEGARDSLEALRAWNEEGRVPYRGGFTRPLQSPLLLKREERMAAAFADGAARIRIEVADADGLRLHISKFSLPAGTNLWVWSDGRDPIWFDAALAGGAADFWTPSVWDDHINFAISAPGGAYELEIDAVAEHVMPEQETAEALANECLVDGACPGTSILDVIAEYRKAVAHYRYVSGNEILICTGALVIDSVQSFTPYLLTANHCVSTQAEASSVEAYWDYIAPSCLAAPPSLSAVPRTNSSALLATSPSQDVTLLRLSSIPNGRVFLGFDPRPSVLPAGTILHRLSHPAGLPQAYSVTRVSTTVGTCETKARPDYVYSTSIDGGGGVAGGSSGSPVILSGGYIVGQLFGHCGPEPGNACNLSNNTVDGALSASFPLLSAYLTPGTTACSPCVPDTNTACLLGNRFKVTMPTWVDSGAGLSGKGAVVKYADNVEEVHPTFGPLSASAFFSMYSFAPKSIESLVRMIKGQDLNNKYWVFLTGFAGAQYTVKIEDTQTCAVWQQAVPANATNVIKDYEAFPFP
jgi:hypothetical protein